MLAGEATAVDGGEAGGILAEGGVLCAPAAASAVCVAPSAAAGGARAADHAGAPAAPAVWAGVVALDAVEEPGGASFEHVMVRGILLPDGTLSDAGENGDSAPW